MNVDKLLTLPQFAEHAEGLKELLESLPDPECDIRGGWGETLGKLDIAKALAPSDGDFATVHVLHHRVTIQNNNGWGFRYLTTDTATMGDGTLLTYARVSTSSSEDTINVWSNLLFPPTIELFTYARGEYLKKLAMAAMVRLVADIGDIELKVMFNTEEG